MIRSPPATEQWAPETDLNKQPVIKVTELNPESSSEGSEKGHDSQINLQNKTLAEPNQEHSLDYDQHDTTARQIPHYDQNSELFDEKHDTQSIDPDTTIDTILEGNISIRPPLAPRRVISFGQFSTRDGLQPFDQSSTKSEDAISVTSQTSVNRQNKIQVPKRRTRIDSLSPVSSTARRILSAETTTATLRRRASSTNPLKELTIEERLVKTHAILKELQYACALPTSHERVTIQRVFDLIDKIRMRQVPHQWSTVDRRLKQVQSSAERIAEFISLVKNHGSDAEGVASMFFACCELALQGKVFDSLSLDALLSVFHRVSAVVQHVKLSVLDGVSSQKLYASFAKMTQVLQRICVGFVEMLDELKKKGNSQSFVAFGYQVNKYFEADISSLTFAASDACQELWLRSLRDGPDSSLESCHGHVLDWLDDHHHHGKHSHGFSRGHESSEESSFVFDCIESLVIKFFKTPSRLLLVTGEVGYGEQEMASNLVERLQLALPFNAKLLRGSFASSNGSASSTTRFLKSLLRQLLDQSVGNTSFLSAINDISKRSEHETMARTEDLLWGLLADQCSKVSGNVAVVVDSIFSSDGAGVGDGLLTKLQELTSKCGNIRCLALADQDAANAISGAQIYALSRADIRRNARQFLQNAMAASATLSVLSAQIRQELLRHIAERQWTSLLEAKLILRLLESEHDLAHMPDIICKTPKTSQGMLDHMILKIDFKNPEMQTLLSWLLASKRPVEVLELEKRGSVTVSNWLRRIRSGRSVSSNSFLASIVTVRNGYVQFVDSLVKARMQYMSLHGKIPLSLHLSHRQVAVDCLKHIRESFSQNKIDIVFQNPSRSKWASASSYTDFDNLLVYSLKNWYDHYEKSLVSSEKLSRHIPSEISSILPDSILMSLAEWYYMRAEYHDYTSLDKALSKILALRRAVFGSHAPSVIQTMINLAHYEKTLGSATQRINLERLIEAFEGAVAVYGDPSPQATSGAKYIFSILSPEAILPSRGDKVCKYLWGVHRRELGDSHDETLFVAQRLADLYKAEMRFSEASDVLHDMYEACARTRGLFASKTIELFHLLIDALEQSDSMNDAQKLCQDIFDAAPSLETWNDAVLSAVYRIVQHYQDRGMADVSKTKLHQLWVLLQGQFKKQSSQADLFVAFTFVSLKLATKLSSLSLEREATSTLKAFWTLASKYMIADRQSDMATLAQLREMAQLLLRLDQHQEALGILRILYDIHQSQSSDDTAEILQVYSALIACYRSVENPLEDFLWLNILDSILLAKDSVGADTVFLCRDLAILHRSRRQQTTAISICRKTLDKLWPQVLSVGEVASLPGNYAGECVQMAVIMAQMYKLTGKEQQARDILSSIVGCCKTYVFRWSTLSEEIANTLSLALEEAELHLEALNFWKSILGDCSGHLGRSHHFTLQIAAAIARLSVQLNLLIDDDDDVCGVLEMEPDEDDLESISMLIEGLFALCRSSGSRGRERGPDLLRWYERLWSYYIDLRHDLAMDTARGFEIFQGHSAVLISMSNISIAIRQARKLRSIFLSDFGRQDIWYLKASLELTKLLEMDDTTVREAVDIYDDINEICLGLATTDDAILAILRIAQERLGVLVSSKPVLHDRAEHILIKAWTQAHKKHGHAHERSIACLQKLLSFWASLTTADYRVKAEEALKEAVLGVMNQEKNPRKLFQSAESFFGMYQIFGLTFRDLTFLNSVRAQISRSENSKNKGLCGQAYLAQQTEPSGLYDRRCLILLYSMEALSHDQDQDGLFAEILTRVVSEAAIYEAWLRACLKGDRLDDLLASGTRLIEYLESYKLLSEAREIRNELWTFFCKSLGRADTREGSTYQLFQAILAASREETTSISLLETALTTAQELADVSNRQACFLLSQWVYGHAQTYADLNDSSAALIFLRLSTLLYSCSETETSIGLSRSIEELATMIGVLAMNNTSDIDLSVMSIGHLSFILSIAGRQKNYKTLKKILELLWTSRNNYDFNLTPNATISIGERLAEVHFACGEYAAAFSLLEDISYNLKDVYGVNHPTALHCQKLLASMHESLGHRKSAIDVRFTMLRDALWGREDYDLDEAHTEGQVDSTVAFYIEQLRSLRYGYASTMEDDDYTWHLEQNIEYLEEITERVKKLTADCETHYDVGDLLEIHGWKGLDRFELSDDVFDVWCAPKDWRVEMEMEEEEWDSTWSVTDA